MASFVRQERQSDPKIAPRFERFASAASNVIRIALCCAWTVAVGLPLLAVIYARYAVALMAAAIGRADLCDRLVEGSAWIAGWVAGGLWTGPILKLLGVRVRIVEVAPVDWARAHVVCANHASLLDIFALVRAVPPPFRFVAKRELTRWPIVGWALRPSGQIVVDRDDNRSAVQTLEAAASRRIRGQVIFFVEGTRSRDGRLREFKKGAFHFAVNGGLPVLPVAICGSSAALARQPWWEVNSGQVIEVRFCAADTGLALAGEPRAAVLRERTRATIARELQRWERDSLSAALAASGSRASR